MKRLLPNPVVDIRRSCLTGEVVWLYFGASRNAARVKYHKACLFEIERMKKWPEISDKRRANIKGLLSECQAEMPINATLTNQQKQAVMELRRICGDFVCDKAFYDHIIAAKSNIRAMSTKKR